MKNKQILKEIKELIETHSTIKVEKVILFGSRASGNAEIDSDHDILIIINGAIDWKIKNTIYNLCYEIDLKYDIVSDVRMIALDDIKSIKGKQPYILNALKHGVVV